MARFLLFTAMYVYYWYLWQFYLVLTMSYYDSENVPLNHWLFAKNQLNGFILDKPNPESNLIYKGSCPVPRVLDKPWQPQLGSLKIYLCTSDKTPRSYHYEYIGIIDEQFY